MSNLSEDRKEAIEKLQIFISKYKQIEKSNNNDHKVVLTVGYEELEAIETVLNELENSIPRKDIEEMIKGLDRNIASVKYNQAENYKYAKEF